MQNRKTFWPYGILLSIFAIVCACAYTIYYSLDYPVYMDDYYFDKLKEIIDTMEKLKTDYNEDTDIIFVSMSW